LPIVLHEEVLRASSWLIQKKQLTNELELGNISISRTIMRSRPESADTEIASFTNGWVATLEFYEPRSPSLDIKEHRVLMLLDGTYATERQRPKTRREAVSFQPPNPSSAPSVSSGDDSEARRPQRHRIPKETPSDMVRRADFQVPNVQWNPLTPFPMDMSDLLAKTRETLLQTYEMPEGFALQELQMSTYLPDGAVPDVSIRMQKHRWHWMIVCHYGNKPSDPPSVSYYAYLLLDGRTLSVSVPEEASAEPIRESSSP
jgi:hypothetical protein